MTAQDRFMAKVRKERVEKITGLGPCWIWRGAQRTNGYGHFQYKDQAGKRIWRGAHQYSWEQLNGAIPAGLVLMHKCDTELCVNPEHLTPGTPAENRADRDAKGRLLGGPRLTARRVRRLRRRHAAGDTVRELAKRFGLRFQTVYRAIKGETWSGA